MTNLDRLADSDLLMDGFGEFIRRWTESRVADGLAEALPPREFSFEGELPEAFRHFFELRADLPHACLGGAIKVGEPSQRKSGHVWFAELTSNWHLGIVRDDNRTAESSWQLCRYRANQDQWTELPRVRFEHLMIESALRSQCSLPHSIQIDDTEGGPEWDGVWDPYTIWEEATANAQIVWTGKVDKEADIYGFTDNHTRYLWDPEGILFYEVVEYNDWDDLVTHRYFASFCTRRAASKLTATPGWEPKRLLISPA